MSHRSSPFKRIASAISAVTLLCFCASALASDLPFAVARTVDQERTLTFPGTVEATRQTALAVEVNGRVTGVLVRPGDWVERGQALLRVDARTAEDQASVRDAEVEAANAALTLARSEFQRHQRLFSEGTISAAALERAEAEYKHSQATAKARLAAASAARTTTRHHVLAAPYDGRIAEVAARLGTLAAPGVPLVKMYDPAELRVRLAIPESDIESVANAPLNHIGIEIAGLAERSPIDRVLVPELEPTTHSAEMQLYLPRDIAPIPGAFATVAFRVALPPVLPSIRIPRQSLVSRADLRVVYVLADNSVNLRLVRVGREIGNEVEILAGLEPGERVALEPGKAAHLQ